MGLFVERKSEVFQKFKEFKSLVEKQSDFQIKALRSDHGGEYVSNEFTHFFKEHGIFHQVTMPYSSQQNRVSERKNRTILNMVRCMLKDKNMPKEFWEEAIACAIYLLNRFFSKWLYNMILE